MGSASRSRINTYGGNQWEQLWEALEQEGNVGLDYVINPPLYQQLTAALQRMSRASIADIGCGTHILSMQYLYGYAPAIPSLATIDQLAQARVHIMQSIGIEGSAELVRRASSYMNDLGNPKELSIIRHHIERLSPLPLPPRSVDIIVSRNFIMHLSVDDLHALCVEMKRILSDDGIILIATLNPEYELRKYHSLHGIKLKENEQYSFSHGATGEHGSFFHYYKSIPTVENIFRKHFQIDAVHPCIPITDRYKSSHPRYYVADCPMALLYTLIPVS